MAGRKPNKPKPRRKTTTRAKSEEGKKASSAKRESEETYREGRVTKDRGYLKRITEKVSEFPEHPIHHNIAMQAHHVISATGMKKSGLGNKIKRFGYNINLLGNLVFLPSTLQGACHLGVQPHRGDHRTPAVLDPTGYWDDDHPPEYHEIVAGFLMEMKLGLTKECPGYLGGAKEKAARLYVREQLDGLSQWILKLIQRQPGEAPLTSVYAHFQPKSSIGCSGATSTTNHSARRPCGVERNHLGRSVKGQTPENITYERKQWYKLTIGK